MTVRGALKIDRMHTGVEPRRPAFRCVSFFSHDISRYCMYSFSFFYRLLPLPACACPPGIGSQIARPEGFQPNQLHKPRFPEHLSDWTSGQSTRTCHHTHSCRTILATFPSPQPRRNTPLHPQRAKGAANVGSNNAHPAKNVPAKRTSRPPRYPRGASSRS